MSSNNYKLNDDLEDLIEKTFKYLEKLKSNISLDPKWEDILNRKGFDKSIYKNIDKFRRQEKFISDYYPGTIFSNGINSNNFNNLLSNPLNEILNFFKERLPFNISMRKKIENEIEYLIEIGAEELLKKYSLNNFSIGKPYFYSYKNININERSLRHFYFLNLIKKNLNKQLSDNSLRVILDLGGAYGFFSYLLKSEYPKTTHIIVDFPQQLVFAKYFLENSFKNVKILDLRNINNDKINLEKTMKYDFILLPNSKYNLIDENIIDLFCGFFSLGEMSQKTFEEYINSKIYLNSKHVFLCNRFESYPAFDKDRKGGEINILKYNLHYFKKISFETFPLNRFYYIRKFIFAEKKLFSSSYFSYLGKKINS